MRFCAVILGLFAASPLAAEGNVVGLTLGGTVNNTPTYFGSDTNETYVSPRVSVDRLKFGRFGFGGGNSDGLDFVGAFRLVDERTADDGSELEGLDDIDFAVELGGGIALSDIPDGVTENWGSYAFANVRYGVIGHESFVAETGANLIYAPSGALNFWAGPRLFGGDDDYAATYFGVTADEALASAFDSFTPSGGVLSRGVSAGVNYDFDANWGIEGEVTYQEFLGDAAESPIVQSGSSDQVSISVSVTRALEFNF